MLIVRFKRVIVDCMHWTFRPHERVITSGERRRAVPPLNRKLAVHMSAVTILLCRAAPCEADDLLFHSRR